MAILTGRVARAGAVGFVIVWATATLAMTAASMDSGPRPSLTSTPIDDDEPATGETVTDEDDAAPSESIETPDASLPTASAPASMPEHLDTLPTIPPPTRVLPSVANGADPVQDEPDFTG